MLRRANLPDLVRTNRIIRRRRRECSNAKCPGKLGKSRVTVRTTVVSIMSSFSTVAASQICRGNEDMLRTVSRLEGGQKAVCGPSVISAFFGVGSGLMGVWKKAGVGGATFILMDLVLLFMFGTGASRTTCLPRCSGCMRMSCRRTECVTSLVKLRGCRLKRRATELSFRLRRDLVTGVRGILGARVSRCCV